MEETEKIEWRKSEKNIYLPKAKPAIVVIPPMKYFSIAGKGNPNTSEDYALGIEALYSLSFTIKMSKKSGNPPKGFVEYAVYPLESVWNIAEDSDGKCDLSNKDAFEYNMMMRQPDFVSDEYADFVIEMVKRKKPNPLLDIVKFETIDEGECIQMLHVGSYDDETRTFDIMDEFAKANSLTKLDRTHREIYLSDPRRVAPEKLKTALRYRTKHI